MSILLSAWHSFLSLEDVKLTRTIEQTRNGPLMALLFQEEGGAFKLHFWECLKVSISLAFRAKYYYRAVPLSIFWLLGFGPEV
jgi:hypothetical protein